MNLEDFKEIGRLKQKSKAFQSKKEKAIALCVEQLLLHETPYVALSAGKDSVVTAYIVDEAARIAQKDFRLWIHVSTASFPGTLETARQVAAQINRPLDIFDGGQAYNLMDKPERAQFGKSGVFYDSVRQYAQDKDLVFTGVRAYESLRRKKAAEIKGSVFPSRSMGSVTVCQPLLWFRLEDIAAAMHEFNGVYHPIYSKQSIQGQNALKEEHWIRLGYITQRDLLNNGTIVFLKLNYPHIYNQLAESFPDVRLYT